MATNPTSPSTSVVSSSSSTPLVSQQIDTLLNHHVTVSYLLFAVLGVTLALGSTGAYFGLKAYDKALSRAETQQAAFNADRRAFTQTLAEHEAQQAQYAQHEADLLAQIAKRNQAPPAPVVQEGLKPDASAESVKNALEWVYRGSLVPVTPTLTNLGQIALEPSQAQEIVSQTLAGQKAQADLKDTQGLYDTEKQSIILKTKDLDQCKSTLAEANKTIGTWKSAAKKSRWQKMKDGVVKVGLFAAGAYLGHRF